MDSVWWDRHQCDKKPDLIPARCVWCISVCSYLCLVTQQCVFATCVWVCELHTVPACVLSRSHFLILRSDAGFSFERRAHNDISFRQHTSGHHGTAQRHLWPRGEGGGGHHAWHIYRRGLRSPLLSSPPSPPSSPSVFVQPPALFTGSSKSLSDCHGCSTPALLSLSLSLSLYLPQPLSSSACFSTNGKCSPLSLCEIFLSQPSILDFHPPSPFFSASLLVKWSHDSKGKMPSGEVTTHWALSNSLPRWTEG